MKRNWDHTDCDVPLVQPEHKCSLNTLWFSQERDGYYCKVCNKLFPGMDRIALGLPCS